HAEQAGAEEAGEQPAQKTRTIEETAAERRTGRTLRARLAGLRHAALDRPRTARCRRRRRRRVRLRAAAAEAAAASGAGVGVAQRQHQRRCNGAKREQRTRAETEHGFLPGMFCLLYRYRLTAF